MAYDDLAVGGVDYQSCRYGASRLIFRGPVRTVRPPYVAVVGGTETFGKFVARPFPALLEETTGTPVLNFGAVSAGIDVFSTDDTVLSACSGARAVVLQVMGAHNVRNRYYSVHPRRNDRFLEAFRPLITLYPDVDFTEFHFTRHLVRTLHAIDPGRFGTLREALQETWHERMSAVIGRIAAPVVLLWLADRAPSDPVDLSRSSDPLFVTQTMIDGLRPLVAGVVHAIPSPAARAAGRGGMVYSGLDAPAAAEVPNARMHEEIAAALAAGLAGLTGHEKGPP